MSNKTDILVVDDHSMFRKLLVKMVQTLECANNVFEASNGKEAVEIWEQHRPGVVLMDLEMKVMSGREATKQILSNNTDTKIVVVTMHDNERFIMEMMDLGAHGYILKESEPGEVEAAINAVLKNGHHYSQSIMRIMHSGLTNARSKLNEKRLTDREVDVLIQLCKEKTSKEIGYELGLSARTVETHKHNIMEKIGAKSIVGLVKYALDNYIVS